jgi:transposase InsO family protein
MDGEVYSQGVIDRGSRRIYPFFLKTKSEAWNTMTQILSDPKFENLKRWHSDGAGELSGKKISDHLASRGVYCTFSPPYSAWTNGIIERSNRTI